MANNFSVNRNYTSIQQMQDIISSNNKNTALNKNRETIGSSFEEILANHRAGLQEIKFSKHAMDRLQDRNIDMSEEQKERLEEGVKKADNKGIKESLIMVDDMAFIVSIKNHTVITAVTGDDEMVFSNIDGAVIA